MREESIDRFLEKEQEVKFALRMPFSTWRKVADKAKTKNASVNRLINAVLKDYLGVK